MKKRQLSGILLAVLISGPASAQFHVQAGASFYMQSSALVSIDGLTLQPSADHTLSNVTITRSTTAIPSAIPFGQSIARVYNFSAPVSFTGTVGIVYEESELNGLTESWLQVATRPGTGEPFTRASNSTVNLPANHVSAVYASPVSLGQVTGLARAVFASAKAYLQGAYNSGLGRHKDVTSNWAAVINSGAQAQPYNYTAFGNYNGGETVHPSLVGPNAAATDAFDWVLLELKNAASEVVSRRAALILENGDITETDGVSPVAFPGAAHGNYSLTIRHRNHLAIRSASTQAFANTPVAFDFTASQASAYQNPAITTNPAMKDLGGGKFGLWGGNANGNGVVNFNNFPQSDRSSILLSDNTEGLINRGLGGLSSAIVQNAYSTNDVNFDSNINFNNFPGSDRSFLLITVLDGLSSNTRTAHQ